MALESRDLDRHEPMLERYVSVHSLLDANGQADPNLVGALRFVSSFGQTSCER